MNATIRFERGSDDKAVRRLHLAAFPTSFEADLVARLRDDDDSEIALVAELRQRVVGHIMLSRMKAEAASLSLRALGLGPVAVLPRLQRKGIGSALITESLARAAERGEEIVFVLGEPAYYSRFGFSVAAAKAFESPYAGPHFMAKALRPVARPALGRADYAPAFSRARSI